MQNPLSGPLLTLLRDAPEGRSEFDLIRALEADLHLEADSRASALGLFQTHFLVMNALYQLRDALRAEGWWLSISPLSVRLLPLPAGGQGALMAEENSALRDYYLDWDAFARTSEEDVHALLDGFWQRYAARDHRSGALAVLGLGEAARWPDIQQAYRTLARRCHPDRGGDAAQFLRVREAYEQLRAGESDP